MRNTIFILATTLAMSWWVMGCGGDSLETRESQTLDTPEESGEEAPQSSSFVEREFWLALAEEPGWHLNTAREEFLEGRTRRAGEEMEKVAAILNFEIRHCHSLRERGLLLASISELREVARGLMHEERPRRGGPSSAELDRVSALAFRTIAAHQVALGRDALVAGDALMAGRYILETTKALESGFDRGSIPLGTAVEADLRKAQQVAELLELEGDGSKEEGEATLDSLDDAVMGLGNVLTGRRR